MSAKSISISKIANLINAEIDWNNNKEDLNLKVKEITSLFRLKQDSLFFLRRNDKDILKKLLQSNVKIIVLEKEMIDLKDYTNKIFLKVDKIEQAFINLLNYYHEYNLINERKPNRIAKDLLLKNVNLVDEEASIEIGFNSRIGANTHIGYAVKIGNNVSIGPNVFIGDRTYIEDGVSIQAGSCIGIDGFSYHKLENENKKINHIGSVHIGQNVDIGSQVTIAKGTIDETEIQEETKIDSHVHVGHNVFIGKRVLIAAHTAIGGSVYIGDDVQVSGHVSIVDHISIGNRTRIFAKSLVTRNLIEDSEVWGIPARDFKKEKKKRAKLNLLAEAYCNLYSFKKDKE